MEVVYWNLRIIAYNNELSYITKIQEYVNINGFFVPNRLSCCHTQEIAQAFHSLAPSRTLSSAALCSVHCPLLLCAQL